MAPEKSVTLEATKSHREEFKGLSSYWAKKNLHNSLKNPINASPEPAESC